MSSTSRATQLGALGFGVVALVCAAFAAFLVSKVVDSKGYSGDKMVQVVVAAKNLPAAQPLTQDDVVVVNWPEASLPLGAAADIKTMFAPGKPLIPTVGILKGEPIVSGRLASSAGGTGIAALVHEGKRAMAIKADESYGRSGLVYPGARVDVVVTFKDQEGHDMTRIAVGDALVLAVESETDVQTRAPRKSGETGLTETSGQGYTGTVVTIEIGPDDAQVMSLAINQGHIDFALRNAADRTPANNKILVSVKAEYLIGVTDLMVNGPPGIELKGYMLGNDGPGAAPGVPSGKGPTPSGKPGDKARIELRAVDNGKANPDRPQEIETYHAR